MAEIKNYLLTVGILLVVNIHVITSLHCNGKADVVFVVPGSPRQVPQHQFDKLEDFLIGVANYYEITSAKTNVGLILYGKNPEIITPLNSHLDKRDVNTRISLMAQRQLYRTIYGGQDVVKAMDAMIKLHTDSKRPGTPKIGVILTYGALDLSGKTGALIAKNIGAAGLRAKKAGIEMFAVTSGGTVPGFEKLADGDKCRLFKLDDYTKLHQLLPYLASGTCYVIDPKVSSTSHKCFPEVLPVRPQQKLKPCSPPDSGFFADPNNCAYFTQCTPTDRIRTRCAGGTLFDRNIKRCNHKEFVSCWSKIKCPRADGLFSHPHYCDQYLNCFHHIPYVQSCPVGLVFNRGGYCDFPNNVKCHGKGNKNSSSKQRSTGNQGKSKG